MVEYVASGRYDQNSKQANHRTTNAGSDVDPAGGMLALFDCRGLDTAALHYFRERTDCRVADGRSGRIMKWSEFFSMGGYGLYVWGSYLTTLLVMGGEVMLLMRRKRALRKRTKPDSN